MEEEVHLAHFHDGYPLCWPMDREGTFSATRDERSVTCIDCINYMKEWED